MYKVFKDNKINIPDSSDISLVAEWISKQFPQNYIIFFKNGLFIIFDKHAKLIPYITQPALLNPISWMNIIKQWSNCDGELQRFMLCLNAHLSILSIKNIDISFVDTIKINHLRICFNSLHKVGIIGFTDEPKSTNLIRLSNDSKKCIISYVCLCDNKIYKVDESFEDGAEEDEKYEKPILNHALSEPAIL